MNRYFLNDLGIVCALGSGRREVAARLLAGDRSGMIWSADYLPDGRCVVGAAPAELAPLPPALAHFDCRNNRLALAALRQIEATVAALRERYGRGRVAVIMGTSTSGIAAGEAALRHFRASGSYPPAYHYRQQELGGLGDCVAALIDSAGPVHTLSTACSSSANALGSAQRLLDLDVCDAAVVGGVDSLCRLTVQGFSALEAVSAGFCQPFGHGRDGINIGEAAALFVLSREPAPVALLGVGVSSDAHHISAPDPSGHGAIAAMREALRQARLEPAAVDYLNLHGTATPHNDAMESAAVNAVFGAQLPCSSTKSLTGHTLGAAGALEAALCWLLLRDNPERRLPPHVADGARDPALAPLHLVAAGERAPRLAVCASNSFAFGGSNTAVVLGRAS
jgi:3-oxoacyl-[acyl-carrier-protein] synthase-1